MNWYKSSSKQGMNVWYHYTLEKFLPDILENGLVINSPQVNFTIGAKSWANDIYESWPIFISKNIDSGYGEGNILLELEMSGLPIIADLPSIANLSDAYFEEDNIAFWDGSIFPLQLRDAMYEYAYPDGSYEIPYDEFLNPHSNICKLFIKFTNTAACIANISPERIINKNELV